MRVELSFHDTTTRQYVENVVTVIYTPSVAVVYDDDGVKWVYPLSGLHRIKEIPFQKGSLAVDGGRIEFSEESAT